MSKQGHKTRANLPAGGFLAIGRDVPSTSDTNRIKPPVHKRELPQVNSIVIVDCNSWNIVSSVQIILKYC